MQSSQPRHRVPHVARACALLLYLFAADAAAGEIPIITLGDSGPDQEVPTDRSFYIAGQARDGIVAAQAIVVRRGSPLMFGDDGPDCHDLIAALHVDVTSSSAGDDDDDEAEVMIVTPQYDGGLHRAFELFPKAVGASRRSAVLVSSPWQRSGDDDRRFKVLVPYQRTFFSPGYGYCLFVVTSEHSQALEHSTIVDL